MPYINEDRANDFYVDGFPETAGELNYCISALVGYYLDERGEDVCYQDLNEVVGVLECAKQEFVSRILNPYEHHKLTTGRPSDPYRALSETLGNMREMDED